MTNKQTRKPITNRQQTGNKSTTGKEAQVYISDGLENAITGLGVSGVARTRESKYTTPKKFPSRQWIDIYMANGTIRRIIDLLANEMTRAWLQINGDDENNSIEKYMLKLSSQKKFADLIRWGKLMGGALGIMIINDGRDFSQPVNKNNIKSIEGIRVVDLSQITIYPQDYYSDITKPNFGDVEFFTIVPSFAGTTEKKQRLMYKVHESRVLIMNGAPTPEITLSYNSGWSAPFLQSCYDEIINMNQAYEYASEAMHEACVNVLKIKDLSNKISQKSDAWFIKRMTLINYSKSLLNSIALDKDNEDFCKVQTQLTQFPEILKSFKEQVASVVGIPYKIIFCESTSGLNSNGESDIQSWYDYVKMLQEQDLEPPLKKLFRYIGLAQDSGFTGEVDELEPIFNNLWQQDDKSLIEMKNMQATIDASYIDRGVLMPEEVRVSRFGTGDYSFDTQIDKDLNEGDDRLSIEEAVKSEFENQAKEQESGTDPVNQLKKELETAQSEDLQKESEEKEDETASLIQRLLKKIKLV